jgi:hypothetical protein
VTYGIDRVHQITEGDRVDVGPLKPAASDNLADVVGEKQRLSKVLVMRFGGLFDDGESHRGKLVTELRKRLWRQAVSGDHDPQAGHVAAALGIAFRPEHGMHGEERVGRLRGL